MLGLSYVLVTSDISPTLPAGGTTSTKFKSVYIKRRESLNNYIKNKDFKTKIIPELIFIN